MIKCMEDDFIFHKSGDEEANWCTPKLFERLKCEFEGENNRRRKSWDTFPSLQHSENKRDMLELQDGV